MLNRKGNYYKRACCDVNVKQTKTNKNTFRNKYSMKMELNFEKKIKQSYNVAFSQINSQYTLLRK